jgi:hypothetical protein
MPAATCLLFVAPGLAGTRLAAKPKRSRDEQYRLGRKDDYLDGSSQVTARYEDSPGWIAAATGQYGWQRMDSRPEPIVLRGLLARLGIHTSIGIQSKGACSSTGELGFYALGSASRKLGTPRRGATSPGSKGGGREATWRGTSVCMPPMEA